MNALLELRRHKQSVWLDYIRRDLVLGGELKRLIEQDGLGGVTSNPAIFEKAIDRGGQYDESLRESTSTQPRAIYDEIAIEDVRSAADVLRPVYEAGDGADGFVSKEPPPQLTTDTRGTIEEARRLRRIVDRPNLMIKVVPAKDGVAAVEALIAEGVNVNITLIFSLRHYEAVAGAYLRGLSATNRRRAWHGDEARIEHWVVAERQGQAVARAMLGIGGAYRETPFFWSQPYDVTISFVGHAGSFWDNCEIRGEPEKHGACPIYRRKGRTIAVATIGRDRVSLRVEAALEQGDAVAVDSNFAGPIRDFEAQGAAARLRMDGTA